jgi:hypothetical protein
VPAGLHFLRQGTPANHVSSDATIGILAAGVWASFNNPFLKDRLAALGFTQNTAFACLFDYLYRPVPEIIEMFKPELNVLLNPDILKIGVQVR